MKTSGLWLMIWSIALAILWAIERPKLPEDAPVEQQLICCDTGYCVAALILIASFLGQAMYFKKEKENEQ